MEKKKIILVIVILIIIAVGAGFYYLGYQSANKVSQEKIKVLENALEPFYPEPPEKIFSISGTIKEIKDNEIKIETPKFHKDLYERITKTEEKETRIIKVLPTTKITKIDYTNVSPEAPFKEEKIKLSELKVGDRITVTAKENIKNKLDFEAEFIQLTF